MFFNMKVQIRIVVVEMIRFYIKIVWEWMFCVGPR